MRAWCRGALAVVVCGATSVLALSPAHAGVRAQGSLNSGSGVDDPLWSSGYVLVELEDGADLNAARRLVQEQGGTIALMLPPHYLTGWIPAQLDASLLGQAGIRHIDRTPLGKDTPRDTDAKAASNPLAAERAVQRFFDRAVQGELDRSTDPGPGAVAMPQLESEFGVEPPGMGKPDAFVPDPISMLDVAANLRQRGFMTAGKSGAARLAANSDFMTGTVSVTLFFLESNGSGGDPDLYDWTQQNEADAFADAAAALSWWSSQAKKHSGCWVTFRLEGHFATQDPRCAQWREPTLHPSTEYGSCVQDVLANFGYTIGGPLARAAAFDAAARIEHDTDWAYAVFAAANPSGPRQFTDGYAAWSYIGGPYVSLLQRSFSWSFKQVFAHETAHMFRACDEYHTPGYGGCTGCGGCADTGVQNGNCEECNPSPVSCMMRTNAWSLCDWTAGQVGWWRTPCTEHSIPAPRLDSVLPNELAQGATEDLSLQGDDFAPGTTVSLGPDVEVLSQDVVSPKILHARVRVRIDAVPGPRDIDATGPDGQQDGLAAALRIRNTPRHYASNAGAGVFPFDRPERAGADLASALAACSTGDTLYVAGGTYAPVVLQRGIVILGGWADDFGARLPQALPTIIDARGNGPAVRIEAISETLILDGLVLRGGHAALISTPELGPLACGGGLLVIDAAPILRGCTFEASTAGSEGQAGAGGGAFFWRAHPRLEGCTVRGNSAAFGAGLYFLQSQASLIDMSIQDNDAYGTGLGAGLMAHSSRLDVLRGAVHSNLGAQDGGGMALEACPLVTCTQTEFDANAAMRNGAGIASHASRLQLFGCRITHNHAGERGGGLHAVADSLGLEATLVAENTAGSLGGGIHLTGCSIWLVNATLARNDGGPASGAYWSDATVAGAVEGCIVAGNKLGGIVAGAGPLPATNWNMFWDNGGFDRGGVAIGPEDLDVDPLFVAPEVLDYHLQFDSPGLDSGDPSAERRDPDASRNDRGAYGGPRAMPPAPPRVDGVTALAVTNHVRVSWHSSRDPRIARYIVCRDSSAAFTPSKANQVAEVDAPATAWIDPAPPDDAWYIVVAIDAVGRSSGASLAAHTAPPSDTVFGPTGLALHRIAPNPANPGAWIEYELPANAAGRLELFSANGARLRVLVAGVSAAGRHRVYWDGRDDAARPVASGVYWVRLVSGQTQRSAKLVVVR